MQMFAIEEMGKAWTRERIAEAAAWRRARLVSRSDDGGGRLSRFRRRRATKRRSVRGSDVVAPVL
jgi:hypothetical protein